MGKNIPYYNLIFGDSFYYESRNIEDVNFFLKYIDDFEKQTVYEVEFEDESVNGDLTGIKILEYLSKNMSKIERKKILKKIRVDVKFCLNFNNIFIKIQSLNKI